MKTAYKQFFGDQEREFKLTPELIQELERKCQAGIGELSRRLFGGDFRYQDVSEIIRLALIGGGEKPDRAQELVALYVHQFPINESYALAVQVVEAAWFGPMREPDLQSIAPEAESKPDQDDKLQSIAADEDPDLQSIATPDDPDLQLIAEGEEAAQ